MKVESIQSALYITLVVIGLLLLAGSAVVEDANGVSVGMGTAILGILGSELQAINKTLSKSREVK